MDSRDGRKDIASAVSDMGEEEERRRESGRIRTSQNLLLWGGRKAVTGLRRKICRDAAVDKDKRKFDRDRVIVSAGCLMSKSGIYSCNRWAMGR